MNDKALEALDEALCYAISVDELSVEEAEKILKEALNEKTQTGRKTCE